MNVAIRTDKHFGVAYHYFADPELQQLYEAMIRTQGKKLVTEEAITFLEQLGPTITER